jgi:hypothetical protein
VHAALFTAPCLHASTCCYSRITVLVPDSAAPPPGCCLLQLDSWSVGALAYDVLCGRAPFAEREDISRDDEKYNILNKVRATVLHCLTSRCMVPFSNARYKLRHPAW